MVAKDEKPFLDSDDDREEYFNVLKTYIKYFFSTEQDNLVRPDDLNPITDTIEVKESQTQKYFQSKLLRNVEESVNLIFEAENAPSGSQSSSSSDSSSVSSPPPALPEKGPSVIGYQYFCYIDYVRGAKKQSRMAGFRNSFKNLASGSIADLRNFKIKFQGGGELKVGRIFSPEEWKNILGINEIDVTKV
jgi:hypothetical protein